MYKIIYGEIENLVQTLLPTNIPGAGPAMKDRSLREDLHAYMHPQAFNFQLVTLSGEPKLIQRDDVTLQISTLHSQIQRLSALHSQISSIFNRGGREIGTRLGFEGFT